MGGARPLHAVGPVDCREGALMLYRLRRHPLPISAFFTHSLVLTYAYTAKMLQPKRLHPAFLPAALGVDFFLTGYRVFTRFGAKLSLRGLRILRSDTDRLLMAVGGNLLTHYGYVHCRAAMNADGDRLRVTVSSPGAAADLEVVADLSSRPAPLPAGSPFANLEDARRFAGPLPYTFDYERETNSIVMIKATRTHWEPQPISAVVRKATFLEHPPFNTVTPILANAFHVENVPYRWERGVVEKLKAAA